MTRTRGGKGPRPKRMALRPPNADPKHAEVIESHKRAGSKRKQRKAKR